MSNASPTTQMTTFPVMKRSGQQMSPPTTVNGPHRGIRVPSESINPDRYNNSHDPNNQSGRKDQCQRNQNHEIADKQFRSQSYHRAYNTTT